MKWQVVALGLLAAPLAVAAESPRAGPEALPRRTDPFGDALPAGALLRLGTTRLRHSDSVSGLAFSPDGKTLASAGNEGVVRLWEVATGRELRQFRNLEGPAYDVTFSPDGKTIAAGDDRTARLWDVGTGKEVRRLEGHGRRVGLVQFFADGRMLATRELWGDLRLWDLAAGREVARAGGFGSLVLFTPGGKCLAGRPELGRPLELKDPITGKAEVALQGFTGWPRCLAFAPDEKTAASVGEGGTVALWDLTTGRSLRGLRVPDQPAASVAYTPDGKSLLLSGYGQVTLWDLAAGKAVRTFPDYRGGKVALSPDGKTLAVPVANTAIRLWDVATGRELHPDRGHEGPVCQLTFSPDGKTLYTAGHDGTVRTWDAATGKELRRLSGIGHDPRLALSADGHLLAASSFPQTDTPVWLWDAATGKELRRIDGIKKAIRSLAFSPDGRLLAGLNYSSFPQGVALRVWDVATGKERFAVEDKGHAAEEVRFSPDGRLLVSSLGDHTIRFWDPATGRQTGQVWLPTGSASQFAFAPDGQSLAMVPVPASGVYLFETATGKAIRRLETNSAPNGVAFSPDGRLVACGSHRGGVAFLCAASGRTLLELPGHGWFSSVAFSPDGRRLATAGADATVLVWDAAAFRLEPGLPPREFTAEELHERWARLGEGDAAAAHQALWEMTAAPAQAVAFLKERLRPALGRKDSAKLIADLDDDAFETRETASRELKRLGPAAEDALLRALEKDPSPEVRRRVEDLLGLLGPRHGLGPTQVRLRSGRAVQVLERIGTKEARAVLDELARGADEARETQDAKAALERLSRR